MAAWNGCRHDGCFDGIGNFDVGFLLGDRDAGMDSLMMATAAWNGCGHWSSRGHESGIMDLARLDRSMPAWVERHILSQIGQPDVLRIWIDWRKGGMGSEIYNQ